MSTQWTTKGNRDAGSSCSCDRGLHRYLRNFGGGGVWTPQTTPSVRHYSQHTDIHALGGIQNHDLSRRAAVDLRLRPRGHCDRLL